MCPLEQLLLDRGAAHRLGGLGAPAWSANAFSLAGDMFPRRVLGSVTGFGGFAGSVGAIALFTIVGKLRAAAVARGEPGDYFLIFLAASLAYLTALLIVHLLAPRLEPAQVEAK